MKRILREPLVHFLVLGAALFAVFQFTGKARAPARPVIEITPGVVQHLATSFARTWQRAPSEEEMVRLLREYLRDEVAYREGQALGLDRDDSIIRMRMRQKLEMLSEETAATLDPDDATLEAYLRAHDERYAVEPAVAFAQVFIDPAKHAADLEAVLAQLGERLRASGAGASEAAEWGDVTLLPIEVPLTPRERIARDFGEDFAVAVVGLEPGTWSQPIRSAYGLHFVRVSAREPGRRAELAAVRETVLRDWQAERKEQVRDELYAQLLSGYEVVFPEGVTRPSER